MEYSKDNIILEYKKLREHLGISPSSRVFAKETGIPLKLLEKFFGRNSWTKLVTESGDEPNSFSTVKVDLEEILIQWANLVKLSGQLPVIADWKFNNCRPSVNNIKSSHGLKWVDIPLKFLETYADNEEWRFVLDLIPKRPNDVILHAKTNIKIEGLDYQYLKFIPPIVQDLTSMSRMENKANEFERGVNQAFRMLGFEVKDYGQGTGRNPDGIAKSNEFRYAILLDAKSRTEGYKIGTEDRKFIEYIKTFSELLRRDGYIKIYFVIVSSKFEPMSEVAVKNIRLETNVSTTFLTANQLLKLLSKKIELPMLFNLKKFETLLIDDGVIHEQKLDKFFSNLKN